MRLTEALEPLWQWQHVRYRQRLRIDEERRYQVKEEKSHVHEVTCSFLHFDKVN